jgi:hypothetical protein
VPPFAGRVQNHAGVVGGAIKIAGPRLGSQRGWVSAVCRAGEAMQSI